MTFSEASYSECIDMNFACHLFNSNSADRNVLPTSNDIAKVKYYTIKVRRFWKYFLSITMSIILQGIDSISNDRDTVYYRDIYGSYQELFSSFYPDMIFQRDRNSVTESSFFVKCSQKSKNLFKYLAHSSDSIDSSFYVSLFIS